jgi:hypothetical protein
MSNSHISECIEKRKKFINMAIFLYSNKISNKLIFQKTKMCSNLNCIYKDKCLFAHTNKELVNEKDLPCIFGPYCIIKECCKVHMSYEKTDLIHQEYYNQVINKKKEYKKLLKSNSSLEPRILFYERTKDPSENNILDKNT